MRQLVTAMFAVLAGFSGARADAATILIVDTGQGTSPYTTLGLGPSNGTIDDDQWLAAEFTTNQPWQLTGIEGWILPRTTGNVNFTLYSDGGDTPGVELFTQSLTVTSTCPQPCATPPPLSNADWFGPTALNWILPAGTYWVAFETRSGSTFRGYMPGSAPNPLLNEATADFAPSAPVWHGTDSLDLGVRITATDADAVPEPASFILVGTGCVGLAARWRRQKMRL